MRDFCKFHKIRFVSIFLVLGLAPAGCGTPTATLDLIAVAQKGLASSREAQQHGHSRTLRQHKAQLAALDGAFDADVKLADAGQLKNAQGKPITMSAQWVISARKGYSAARSLLDEQIRTDQTAHAVDMDNILAAEEALELASQLIVLQWNVGERFKQQFMKLQRLFKTKDEKQ